MCTSLQIPHVVLLIRCLLYGYIDLIQQVAAMKSNVKEKRKATSEERCKRYSELLIFATSAAVSNQLTEWFRQGLWLGRINNQNADKVIKGKKQ